MYKNPAIIALLASIQGKREQRETSRNYSVSFSNIRVLQHYETILLRQCPFKGSLTRQGYLTEVLEDHIINAIHDLEGVATFIYDNTRPQILRLVTTS